MLLLLLGYAGAGKDEFANWLVKNKGFVRMAFADELKQELSDKYSIPLEYFHNRELKEKPFPEFLLKRIHDLLPMSSTCRTSQITPRMLCIEHGKYRRSQDINYWVKKIKSKIKDDMNVVISDCGYHNEQEQLRDGIKIWIERSNLKIIEDGRDIRKLDCEIVLSNHLDRFDGEYLYKQLMN